ncbi:MAG: peptide chain release factor N(5)-glutamine methyltransferase [Lachnospira sp.]|nr:peptide chain release factor N(5)-glutamine methyltransferase [Lachnospira sp.]
MASIVETVKMGADKLRAFKIDNPDIDSFELFSDITGITKMDYLVHGKREVSQSDYDKFKGYIDRRCSHEPLQHILGKAWFYGRTFTVNRDVLIPRFDTEVLIEQSLKLLKGNEYVLDMCTGSGCIIATLALERKLGKAVGVDLSKAAIEVAKDNMIRLGADVELIQSDLFTELEGKEQYEKWDMIVSNPPYIETSVINTLSEEVRCFDPIMALDGYEDGLHFYRCITKKAKHFLKKDGVLVYEIGHNQGQAVSSIMKQEGFYGIHVVEDYAGLDRVVIGFNNW